MKLTSIDVYKDNLGFRIVFRFRDNGVLKGCDVHIKDNATIKDIVRTFSSLLDELRHFDVSAIGTAAASGASELQRASKLQNNLQDKEI